MNDFLLSRYKPCHKQLEKNWESRDFQEYIDKTVLQIKRCRTDLTETNKNIVLHANSPFELPAKENSRAGILLFHGLLDSPFGMHDLASVLQQQGYLVRGILLPGHGTRPGDLLKVTLNDWLAATQTAIEQTLNHVDKLFVLGFSGGASLALLNALNNDNIAGVISIAPSLRLLNKAAALSGLIHVYGHYRKKHHWFARQINYDYARYEAFPANLAVQAAKLAKFTRKQLQSRELPQPWLTILTADDETVCSETVYDLFNKTNCEKNRLLMYSNKMPQAIPDRVEYRISRDLNNFILDYSHICLPISPNNSHYGVTGDQENQILLYDKSIDDKSVYQGAVTRKNRANYNLQRLLYNPDFNYMAGKIVKFIEELI